MQFIFTSVYLSFHNRHIARRAHKYDIYADFYVGEKIVNNQNNAPKDKMAITIATAISTVVLIALASGWLFRKEEMRYSTL